MDDISSIIVQSYCDKPSDSKRIVILDILHSKSSPSFDPDQYSNIIKSIVEILRCQNCKKLVNLLQLLFEIYQISKPEVSSLWRDNYEIVEKLMSPTSYHFWGRCKICQQVDNISIGLNSLVAMETGHHSTMRVATATRQGLFSTCVMCEKSGAGFPLKCKHCMCPECLIRLTKSQDFYVCYLDNCKTSLSEKILVDLSIKYGFDIDENVHGIKSKKVHRYLLENELVYLLF